MNDPRRRERYTSESSKHRHEKYHPDWQGTFNLDQLFELPPELYSTDSHNPDVHHDYYSSSHQSHRVDDWTRYFQHGRAYH